MMNDQSETPKRHSWRTLVAMVVLALLSTAAWTLFRTHHEKQRNAALWEAVEEGNLSTVIALLDQGADPNTHEYQVLDFRHGRSLAAILMRLFGREPTYNQDPNTQQWTADPRAPGHWTTRQKWNTALWLATENDCPDIARALIARGAKDRATGYLDSALMWAAERGYTDIVQSLLANGAEVNASNDFGDTALDFAISRGDVEIVKILLRHGADPHRPTALLQAKESGSHEIVELIKNGSLAK